MRKILIIDDEKDFCYFMKKNLETADNFKVAVCCNPKEGIKYVRELRPDIILLDILMPEVSGQQIAAELKNSRDTQNIPVIFLTALITPDESQMAEHYTSGIHVMAKPVQMTALTHMINELVNHND